MEIQNPFKNLLSKKMDRKDFLRHIGIGVVALIGGGVLLRFKSTHDTARVANDTGYGGMAYGGEKHTGNKPPGRKVL